jgi:uncharacterized SAM-binding protein YcdF (DUF218 family)
MGRTRSGGTWLVRATLDRLTWLAIGATTVAAMTIWYATATGLLSSVLISPLEDRFERAEVGDPQTITGIIALEGDDNRIREAGRLARKWPHTKIAASYHARSRLLSLLGDGIAPDRVLIEDYSQNTYENAVFLTAAVKARPCERWLLVTSASHMPRAIGAFRKSGFLVEPWPIYSLDENVYRSAIHEWVGMVVYWLRGQTSALFPNRICQLDSA